MDWENCWVVFNRQTGQVIVRRNGVKVYEGHDSMMPPDVRALADEINDYWEKKVQSESA